MGVRTISQVAQDEKRGSFTVPATSGSYAFERITFGAVPSGVPEQALTAITVNVDASIATMVVELWLPRIGGGSKPPSTFVDGDYQFSGKSIGATGSETWPLAGYTGAQLRVKSGGTSGTATLSATVI